MRLILVRHGETDWNREHRVQGLSDIELNETGRRQAEAIAQALKNENIEAIYTSPLKRALVTAQAINQFHQVAVDIEDGLKELDTGELDGLTWSEMNDRYGDFLREWVRDAALIRLPGGECLEEIQDRVWAPIERIIGKHPHQVVVIVSHYFVILSIVCQALGINLSHFRRLSLDVGATSILDMGEPGVTLSLFNDTCYLREGKNACTDETSLC